MTQSRKFVLVIGQIPPPTDGLAAITSEFVKLLSEDHDVQVLNISPRVARRGLRYHVSRAAIVLLAALPLLKNAYRCNRACYMPCQSDFGLVYTIYLLAIARLLGYPTYLHHHNFGYINQTRQLMTIALRTGGRKVCHIFLCERMRIRFLETYRKPERSIVISNAAFVSPQPDIATARASSSLTLGLLSNLNREKGLYTFLDLLRVAQEEGLNVKGILAGPLHEAADKVALEAAQSTLGDRITYTGPLYDERKLRFYETIDVFVFPTTYANEAQPTVLYEALAAGALVLTYERGCIASQVQGNGLVIAGHEAFVPQAIAWLRNLQKELDSSTRASISLQMKKMHHEERARARDALSFST